jgi:hypothetical protein
LALSRVHGVHGDQLAPFREVNEMTGGGLEVLSGPAASIVAARWQRINYEPMVLTHYDSWSGNVVWDAHRLSGIVDWNRGSLGPRGFDVGWCRLDLYLLYGEQIADLFLHSYEAAFGEVLSDPALWDLWAVARSDDAVHTWVPNYRDLGRPDLTAEVLRKRHREWTDNSWTVRIATHPVVTFRGNPVGRSRDAQSGSDCRRCCLSRASQRSAHRPKQLQTVSRMSNRIGHN